jgi:hypothetical protein
MTSATITSSFFSRVRLAAIGFSKRQDKRTRTK